MIRPECLLHIYEIPWELERELPSPPDSFVGLWNEEGFSYLFFTREEDHYIDTAICCDGGTYTSRHEMAYRDWQAGLPPGGLTHGSLTFVPADHPRPPIGSILLDPSVVFGDGNHPTTISCLNFLETIVQSDTIETMLDLGTGSGILGLAAASMGLTQVIAVDKNRLAVATATKNVSLNGYDMIMRVFEGEARLFLNRSFDVVAANLPFGVLRDLAAVRGASQHRFWIVSGINSSQAETLKSLFHDQGYRVHGTAIDHPWETFVLKSP